MKKRILKPVIISALSALAFGAVGVAGTFALFTDNAETEISITAGKIDLRTTLKIKDGGVASLNPTDPNTAKLTDTSAKFENGGTAEIDNDTHVVTIQKWTPGDKLILQTIPNNEGTDIDTLMRLKIIVSGQLAPALVIKGYEGTDTDYNLAIAGAGTLVSPWQPVYVNNEPSAYSIEIAFPDHDNGEIKFGDENKDNQYMEKEATITVTYEAVQGNASYDELLDRINTRLATESVRDGGNNPTMYDALDDLTGIADEATIKAKNYVWGRETDMFYVSGDITEDQYKYFKVADNAAGAGQFSIYASNAWSTSPVNLTGIGFDAGDSTGVMAVNYVGASEARHNIIRTNSLATTITVNAPNDIVEHYGDAASVNIQAVAGDSYHEHGKIAFAEIATGRIVLEPTSAVKRIHLVATNTQPTTEQEAFLPITIKDNGVSEGNLPTKITRDQVNVPADDEKLVVTVVSAQEVKEKVYVYPHEDSVSATGTTEKITEGENKQNPTIETVLGVLALDSNNDAGEKAMSENEKDAEQAPAINEVVADEDYVARISTKFYKSFNAAFADVENNDTLYVINDCSASSVYDVSGKNLNIFVEPNVTLSCGSVQNGKFEIGWMNTSPCVLTLEGTGRITFNKHNSWGLITQNGSGDAIKAIVRDVTIEANAENGYIMEGNLTIESGTFNNITAKGGTKINGGSFTSDVSAYVKSGYYAKWNEDSGYYEVHIDDRPAPFTLIEYSDAQFTNEVSRTGINDITYFENSLLNNSGSYLITFNQNVTGPGFDFSKTGTAPIKIDLQGFTFTFNRHKASGGTTTYAFSHGTTSPSGAPQFTIQNGTITFTSAEGLGATGISYTLFYSFKQGTTCNLVDLVYPTEATESDKDYRFTKITDIQCYAAGTMIALANGLSKPVEDITAEDQLLTWNMFTGQYEYQHASIIVDHGGDTHEVLSLNFDDGTTLRIIGEHGVFDYDLNQYVYIDSNNYADYIGHRFVKENVAEGDYRIVTLTSGYITLEWIHSYSLTTSYNFNVFAEGLLTVAPPANFYTWIEMSDTKLQYDVEAFMNDVELYGLYDYQLFEDYITYEQFLGFNGAYLKVAVEKGQITLDEIFGMIRDFGSFYQ